MKRFILFVLLISSLCSTGCFFKQQEHTDTRFLMDTLVTITTYGQNEAEITAATDEALTAMKNVADATDPYESHLPKDLYFLNTRAGQGAQKVNPILYTLLKKANGLHHKEMNLALGPVIRLWQTHSKAKTVPSQKEITSLLAMCPDNAFTLNGADSITLAPKAQLDLGAIAKGYGVDAAAAALKKNAKVTSALINAGGNIMVLGTKEDKKPWRIGIAHPRKEQQLLGTLELASGMAIATSGDYQRYYEVNGQRYHHLLDPKTGYPAKGTISATAVAHSGFLSDYYSTVLFILPLEEAKALVEATPDLEAIIYNSQGELYVSPGLKNTFILAK